MKLPLIFSRKINVLSEENPLQTLKRMSMALLLCFLIYAFTFAVYSWRDEKIESLKNMENMMELEARALDTYFVDLEEDLKELEEDLIQTGSLVDLNKAYRRLGQFKNHHLELLNVAIMRADGEILLTAKHPPGTVQASHGKESSFINFINQLQRGKNFALGQTFFCMLGEEGIFPVRHAIRDVHGRLIYILSAHLPQQFLQLFLTKSTIIAQAPIGLLNNSGFLLSRYPVPVDLTLEQIYGQPRTGALIHFLQEQGFPEYGSIQGLSSLDGPNFLNVFRRLTHYPLTVFIAMPISEVRVLWWNKVSNTYFVLLLLLIGSYIAYLHAVRRQIDWDNKRGKLEKAEHDSKALKTAILNSVSSSIVVIDDKGLILTVNESWKRYGAKNAAEQVPSPPFEWIGVDYLKCCKNEGGEEAQNGIQSVLSGDLLFFTLEYSCDSQQEKHWFSMAVTPLNHTLMGGAVIAHTEISEIKLAHEALSKHQTILEAVINGTRDAVYVKDMEGRYLLMNSAAALVVGKRVEDVIGQDDYFVFPPAEADILRALDRAVLAGESIVHHEEMLTNSHGQKMTFEVTKGPLINQNGQIIGLFGDARDITERKANEIKITESLRAAEAATRAKSEFLAHMSHEIRTPMNAIVGAARLIEYENLTPRQLGYAEIMRQASQSLLALIDNILDFSKIEAGQIAFKNEIFALTQTLDGVLSAASVLGRNKDIEIKLVLASDLPLRLIGDPHRLEQVLNNLLSNAIKFTEQGFITLRVEQQLIVDTKKAKLFFEVSDSGKGMSARHLQTIFDPFVQVESTTTREQEGIGLGLAISRQLVELMGGKIEVDSIPGEGSRFWFTAVFKMPSATEIEATSALSSDLQSEEGHFALAATSLAGRRVLVVEDNEFNRQIIEAMLSYLGIEVDMASNGQDGIECYEVGSPYDAILMDLHLPGIDGFGCARAIRALPGGWKVPIIAFTANVLATTASECHASGMNDYLQKPIEPEKLQHMLMHWIIEQQASGAERLLPVETSKKEEKQAKAEKTPDLADRLPDELPGLDLAKASAWSHGSARVLAQQIERALVHCADDPTKLAQHCAAGEVEAAAQITHDLMGVAATLGASALVEAARQLNRQICAESLNDTDTAVQESIEHIAAEIAHLQESLALLRAMCL